MVYWFHRVKLTFFARDRESGNDLDASNVVDMINSGQAEDLEQFGFKVESAKTSKWLAALGIKTFFSMLSGTLDLTITVEWRQCCRHFKPRRMPNVRKCKVCEDREKRGVWGFIVKRSVLLRRSRTRERSGEKMETGREIGERHFWGLCLTMKNFFSHKLLSLILFIYLFFVTFAAYAQPQTGN